MLPAGTGKTTVARRVGQLFNQLGLLATSDVLDCSASDFVTGYANQASGKTRELFQKAVGGVLFIDEAYRWASGWSLDRRLVSTVTALLLHECRC